MSSFHKKAYGKWGGNPNGRPPDLSKCAAEIRNNYRLYQCTRARGHGPEQAFCKMHDPERIAQREAERKAKFDAEYAAARERSKLNAFAQKAIDALRSIANGHNDPRSLASEIIAEFERY